MAEKSLEVKKDFESLVFSEEGRDFIGSIDTIKDVINFRFLEKNKSTIRRSTNVDTKKR